METTDQSIEFGSWLRLLLRFAAADVGCARDSEQRVDPNDDANSAQR